MSTYDKHNYCKHCAKWVDKSILRCEICGQKTRTRRNTKRWLTNYARY